MIVTDHSYASLVGLRMLEEGGNAFDACVAASAVLGVTMPHTSGLGGDAFVIAQSRRRTVVLNSSGRAPSEIDQHLLRRLERAGVPQHGPHSVTVPGLVEAWRQVVARFATLPIAKLLKAAAQVAAKGFPASRRFARTVASSRPELRRYGAWYDLYGAVEEGSTLVQKRMASLLDTLIGRGLQEFYRGATARRLVEELRAQGGLLTAKDFEAHEAEWVQPIGTDFQGFRVYEMPPNTQGVTSLQLLRLYALSGATRLRFGDHAWTELLMKIAAIAYRDRNQHVADPKHYATPVAQLLDDTYLRRRLDESAPARLPIRAAGDTTFLAAADGEGNVVGFIQSLYYPFGSGIVAGGIPWHNRGYGFDAVKDSPNRFAPGKRPRHTLSAMLAQRPEQMFCIGCAGADLRPQLHLLTLAGVACHGLTLEGAVGAPRRLVTFDGAKSWLLWEGRKPRGSVGPVVEGRPSPGALGIVNALELCDNYQKAVADPRGEGAALALP